MRGDSRVILIRDESGIKIWYKLRFEQTNTPQRVCFYYDKRSNEYHIGLPADYENNKDNYILYRSIDNPSLISWFDVNAITCGLHRTQPPKGVVYPKYKHLTDAEYAEFARHYNTIPLADLIANETEATADGKD